MRRTNGSDCLNWFRTTGAAFAAAAAVLTLAAVSETKAETAFKPVTPGVLTVATQVGSPGTMEGTDPENMTGGTEWELSWALARGLGLEKVKFINVGFNQLISGSLTGYDVGIFGIFKTEARMKVNTYSECYSDSFPGMLLRTGVEIKTVEDARKIRWGYITGTFQGLLIEKLAPEVEPRAYPDSPTLYSAIEAGRVDAITADLSHMVGKKRRVAAEAPVYVAGIFHSESMPTPCSAVQFPRNVPEENVKLVNEIIEKVVSSGDWDKWIQQYQGYEPSDYPHFMLP